MDGRTNKYKMCDNCRRERAIKLRKGVQGVAGTLVSIAIFVVAKGKHDGGGNKA